MSAESENFDDFEVAAPEAGSLVVTVDGFEGPLDLLLTLARNQKVDIAKISVMKLAEQYLEFIEEAKRINLELAADYLVMAAWLAYLKSRLVLPQEKGPDGEPSADEMATRLRWRLQRLDAMRAAATRLMGRERLDRDVFGRGDPEAVNVIKLRTYKDTLYDLLTAYATDRVRKLGGKAYKPEIAPVLQIEEARERLERMLGKISDWSGLSRLLPFEWQGGARRRSAMASTLLACLELARDGKVELQQMAPFEEIYVRDRAEPQGRLSRTLARRECDMSSVAKMIAKIEDQMDAEQQTPLTTANPEHLRMIEALLFAASEPVDQKALATSLPEGADVPGLLAALEQLYEKRGVTLCCVAGKYQFRTASDLAFLLRKEQPEQKRLSKAAIETLAIVAYHQPVTRAEIEDIRGVAMSKGTVDTLMEIGWVKIRGRKRTPGRPVTYGTTEAFLVQFGLESVSHLPGTDELKAAGFLEAIPPSGFDVPNPSDILGPDEDPYTGEEPEDLATGSLNLDEA